MGTVFHGLEDVIGVASTVSGGISYLTSSLDFIAYILCALACLQLSKKVGIPYAWRGFIPFADQWLLGRLADVGNPRGNTHWQLLVLFIGKTVFLFVYKLFSGMSKVAVLADQLFDVTFPTVLESGFDVGSTVFCVIGYACSIAYTVVLCMGYYRLAKNFGRQFYLGYYALLVVGAVVNPLVSTCALVLLSFKEPAVTVRR